jgi:hypothetical protein
MRIFSPLVKKPLMSPIKEQGDRSIRRNSRIANPDILTNYINSLLLAGGNGISRLNSENVAKI